MSFPAQQEDDLFWTVQLSGDAETKPPMTEVSGQRSCMQDHALPAGTELTDESFAEVLGPECEISIPLRRASANNVGKHECVEGGGTKTVGQTSLVLKLRQVNGDGVLSGVGGDVWCAALLLSTWLLDNSEIVRGLDVLELGSGLGLGGITAGYLAKSATLTDYVDELLENLHHNVRINRSPRISILKHPDDEARHSIPNIYEAADRGAIPEHQRPQRKMFFEDSQNEDDISTSSAAGFPSEKDNTPGSKALKRCHQESSGKSSSGGSSCGNSEYINSTVHRHDQIFHRQRHFPDRHPSKLGSAENHSSCNSSCISGGEADDLSRKAMLQPISSFIIRKLDWMAYAGYGDGGALGSHKVEEQWWDDRGSSANQAGVITKTGRAGTEALRCDVVVGSALVYSPHHACVADVLSHAFAEGGCRAAYIVQLSTRPGFDDFLHRLGSCGLRYRLQKMSAVLPEELLGELGRCTPITVVGGRVNHQTNAKVRDVVGGLKAGTAGFDEFVLCCVSRPEEADF